MEQTLLISAQHKVGISNKLSSPSNSKSCCGVPGDPPKSSSKLSKLKSISEKLKSL